MNVMVIGRGGREHSIALKLSESDKVEKIFAAPGNAGMEAVAKRVAIEETDTAGLIGFANEHAVDLTIVGPENPLMDGVVDAFQEKGLKAFGPSKAAAILEGSKQFAKDLMKTYEVPTAAYQVFNDADAAKAYIEQQGAPIVVKADGLAAGKGVVVAETVAEAQRAVDDMLVEGQFGEASNEIVIEEFLTGEEFSLMAFVNGEDVYPMIPSQDHKRAYDGDRGPNTGGMGAYAPVPFLTDSEIGVAVERILKPIAKAMVKEDRPFTGILYAGLIQTEQGPQVIEFNARFGDPEVQVVLPLMKNDLVQVIEDVLNGEDPQLEWEDAHCAGVVLASAGYPGSYQKGVAIPAIEVSNGAWIVHAGTKRLEQGFVSDGGRVLLAAAKGDRLSDALDTVYASLNPLDFHDDFFYRTDIGKGALRSSLTEK
ncbi:phosphoribosylamine--glycine ligase [Thalassobacillus hwangdonensis]|uniref:Phosphoribosylamine--glycine ligase n=1 Tax=Thalassobacillus hwangdonensis TaxID=546108 RepID=A0ABW3L5I4_9BACI